MSVANALLSIPWHDVWKDIVVPDIPIVEKILRPVLVYVFLLIGLRLAGKRELAQLNPFDFIVLMTLSNTVQNAIIGSDNSVVGGMIGATALLSLNYWVVRVSRSNRRLQRLLGGKPEVLVRDGKVQKDHMERELISKAELVAAAHKQGIGSLHDVELCVLEPTGTISFIEKRPTRDATQHNEIMDVLRRLNDELTALKAARIPDPESPPFNP